MRWLLRAFPSRWRDRYGEEFLEQFAEDSRRVVKLADAARTVTGLWWEEFRASTDGPAAGLGALLLAFACDAVLGIGMDERIDVELLSHWWGVPFIAGLVVSAAITTVTLVALLVVRRRRRSFVLLTVGIAAGAAIGSAVLAAVSLSLAGLGAGVGLALGALILRLFLRAPLARGDGLILGAIPIIVILGWRSASSPVGPLCLLLVAGGLLTTRVQSQAPAI